MGIKQDEEPYHITQLFTFDVICVNHMCAPKYTLFGTNTIIARNNKLNYETEI